MKPGGAGAVLALWEPLKKSAWPLAKKAAVTITAYLATHPEAQERLAGVGRRLTDVQKARTPEGRIRRGLVPIREHAHEVVDAAGDSPAAVQAQSWLLRADHIERALGILEHRPRSERKEGLAAVVGMTDALTAEVLLSLIPPPTAVDDQHNGEVTRE